MTNVSARLTSIEARRRLAEIGPNAVVEKHVHPLERIARHFWAPVPWMLEATIVLQIVLGQWLTALLIALLLVLNVLLGAIQEGRADAALALLKQRKPGCRDAQGVSMYGPNTSGYGSSGVSTSSGASTSSSGSGSSGVSPSSGGAGGISSSITPCGSEPPPNELCN